VDDTEELLMRMRQPQPLPFASIATARADEPMSHHRDNEVGAIVMVARIVKCS
jgi:hypothetical protein